MFFKVTSQKDQLWLHTEQPEQSFNVLLLLYL